MATSRLRNPIRLLLVGALLTVLTTPVQADEPTSSKSSRVRETGCGGRWKGEDTCKFRYAGGGLAVDGSFRADHAGAVVVTLEAVHGATGRRVPVLTCSVAGHNFSACAASSTRSMTISLVHGQKLFCSVQGVERGRYGCSSTRI